MNKPSRTLVCNALRGLAGFAFLAGAHSYAANFKITVENLATDDGLWFSPVFFGFHDGSFDLFDPGTTADNFSGIEMLAEQGDSSGLAARFGSDANAGAKQHVLLGQDGASGPPDALFAPSNFNPDFSSVNSFVISLDPTANRFLSFASMVVPSNDAFLSNPNPLAYELFSPSGVFNSTLQINLFGSNIWDSGTELNDEMGAAFSRLGGISTDTSAAIALHEGLDDFIGTPIAVGPDLGHAFSDNTPIARITVEQVPDHTPFAASLGALALIGFRVVTQRRRKKA